MADKEHNVFGNTISDEMEKIFHIPGYNTEIIDEPRSSGSDDSDETGSMQVAVDMLAKAFIDSAVKQESIVESGHSTGILQGGAPSTSYLHPEIAEHKHVVFGNTISDEMEKIFHIPGYNTEIIDEPPSSGSDDSDETASMQVAIDTLAKAFSDSAVKQKLTDERQSTGILQCSALSQSYLNPEIAEHKHVVFGNTISDEMEKIFHIPGYNTEIIDEPRSSGSDDSDETASMQFATDMLAEAFSDSAVKQKLTDGRQSSGILQDGAPSQSFLHPEIAEHKHITVSSSSESEDGRKLQSMQTAVDMLTEPRLESEEDSRDEQEGLLKQETGIMDEDPVKAEDSAPSVVVAPPMRRVDNMAVHQRVAELDAYVVPFEERECPEHTFMVTLTRAELIAPCNAKDNPVIWKITYALLNAIGGILIMKSTDRLTEIEWDPWRQRCVKYLQRFLSKKITASIHFKSSPSEMIMFIPKSQDLMLYNLCISTRSQSGNKQIIDLYFLVDVLNRKSEAHHHVQMNPSYSFDEEFAHGESQNREYGDMLCDIATGANARHPKADKRFSQTLLAMANESCGGEVIFGIYEDRQQGKLLIKGLYLEDADREAFEARIDAALRNDPVTGELRVWREPRRFPQKNIHWRVKYHDVVNTPDNKRRVIARIQIDHYPGGVFEVEPVAFEVDQNGYVTQKPFSEWREGLNRITPDMMTKSTHKAGKKNKKCIGDQAQHVAEKHQAPLHKDSEITVDNENPEAMNAALMCRKELSWTKDKLNWSEGIGDSEVELESYITSNSCFALKNPLNFNPPKILLRCDPLSDVSVKIQEIEKYHQSDNGFVICAKSWMSNLMEKMETPRGHVMDLLVFVQKEINKGSNNAIHFHELHLWVICGTAADQKDDWKYAIQTSLSLKQQLVDGGCPSISVICHTLRGDNRIRSSGHQEEITKYLYCKSEETVELVKQRLSEILFQKEFYFTTTLGNQALINLTEEQAESLFMGELSRITFIRGPPGSGKTILAQYIAKQYKDPKKVVFICTTKSFQKYIVFSAKCGTYFVKSATELKKWIQSEGIKNIECLIFDDVHNLECTKEDWFKILEQLVLSKKYIHLFADPDIQVYKETTSMAALKDALGQIEEKYHITAHQKQLTAVHRNTRKVTSFIIDAVAANTHPSGIQIKAAHSLDGDDIETMYKGGLRLKGAENDLVLLIQELTQELHYEARGIAVLLGGEQAEADKIFYTEVLRQHLDCEVHGADHNPREGVQVDVVGEYAGLDAPVVVHLNSDTASSTHIDNPKYRSFIASRGIFRVIFLVEEPLNHQDYKRMNLDRPLKSEAASDQEGKSSNKNYVTSGLTGVGEAQLGAVGGADAGISLSLPPEVEPEQLMLLPYQEELAREAMEGNNVIIVAPTGSGKTHVAMGITKRHLEELRDEGSDEGKVVFLVPTVDLVQQQWKQYRQYLSEYTSFGMSGDIGDSQKVPLNELIPGNDIIIMTPQIMVDALKKDHLESLGQFTLMIFDECHHTTKDHPYNGIMKHYMEEKFRDNENRTYILPQIVGLTASVGVGKAWDLDGAVTHILTLCANLDSVDVVTVKQTKAELDKHVNKPTEDKIETQGRCHDGFRAILNSIMQTIETFVKQHPGVKKVKEVPNFESLLNPPLNKGSDPYVQWASNLDKPIAMIYDQAVRRPFYSALSHLKVYNRALMINSDCRTKDALVFINKEFKEIEGPYKDETDLWLEELFQQNKRELERCNDPNPKLLELEKIILDHYRENNDMRGIIFCKTREMTLALQNWMLETPSISHLNPHRIVGGASTEKGGMSQNKQVDVLRYFKDGKHKVIVATSVAEEGLDVRKCDLVIRYEYVTNEIAMVQARGRGRAEDAKYIVLGEKGKGTKEKDSLNKIRESMMNKAIERVKQLDPADKEQRIRDLQNRLQIERKMADIGKKSKLQARSRNGIDDWVLRCLKCDQFACSSADIRIVESSHHVVMDNTFCERVQIEEHPNPMIYGDFKKTGKVLCGKCKYDWGIVAIHKSVKFEVIKIVSFVVINVRTERRTTCKKWKDAPFPAVQLTPEDLQTRVKSLDDED